MSNIIRAIRETISWVFGLAGVIMSVPVMIIGMLIAVVGLFLFSLSVAIGLYIGDTTAPKRMFKYIKK